MKKVTYEEYQKEMNKVIEGDLPIDEKLVKMLEVAGSYELIIKKDEKKRVRKATK